MEQLWEFPANLLDESLYFFKIQADTLYKANFKQAEWQLIKLDCRDLQMIRPGMLLLAQPRQCITFTIMSGSENVLCEVLNNDS